MCVLGRDGNFCPTRRYPARPDPNGSGFTRFDKEKGRVWGFFFYLKKKNPKRVWVLIKTRPYPTPPNPIIYLSTKIPSYIYLVINPSISYHFTFFSCPTFLSLSFSLSSPTLNHSLSSPLTTTATTKPQSLSSLLTTKP